MSLYEHIIRSAPMFSLVHRSLVQEISVRLRAVAVLPGAWIFREGDVGHEMLFTGRGTLQVRKETVGVLEFFDVCICQVRFHGRADSPDYKQFSVVRRFVLTKKDVDIRTNRDS